MTAPKYNTMLDLAFSVEHDFDDPYELIENQDNLPLVLAALERRLAELRRLPTEAGEAFGICDTYEIPKENT
jgi:hypothetical protein